MTNDLTTTLLQYSACYDEKACLLKVAWRGPGYHTKIPNGTIAHPIRENLDYVLILLESGKPEHVARAEDILATVLRLQDLDSYSPTFGIWPYLAEESLAEMSPPDWNWADFCGIRLGHIWRRYWSLLAPHAQEQVTVALRSAALAIFRRNVGSGYTNIAIKGAIVAGLAGEMLSEKFLIEYAASRLRHFIRRFEENGGINEYNSPPYGMLVVQETERGLFLLTDPVLKQLVKRVHSIFWGLFSQSLHLPTGQFCGPQSRAYQDQLPFEMVKALEERLGLSLFRPARKFEAATLADTLAEPLFLVPAIPCPEDILARIKSSEESFMRHGYIRSATPEIRREAAIWRNPDLCLGSINYDNLWTQRRPILGYWRVGDDIAILRVRMKYGGQDFASGAIRVAQDRGTILAVAGLATNKGDYHDHLDRPADGVFRVEGLELSIEVHAPSVKVVNDIGESFTLTAGDYLVRVQPLLSQFGDYQVQWEAGLKTADCGIAKAVINGGAPVVLDSASEGTFFIAFSILVTRCDMGVVPENIRAAVEGDEVTLRRKDDSLTLSAPISPRAVRDHFTP